MSDSFQWLTRHHLLCNLAMRGMMHDINNEMFQWLTRHNLLCNIAKGTRP